MQQSHIIQHTVLPATMQHVHRGHLTWAAHGMELVWSVLLTSMPDQPCIRARLDQTQRWVTHAGSKMQGQFGMCTTCSEYLRPLAMLGGMGRGGTACGSCASSALFNESEASPDQAHRPSGRSNAQGQSGTSTACPRCTYVLHTLDRPHVPHLGEELAHVHGKCYTLPVQGTSCICLLHWTSPAGLVLS